MIAQIFGIKTYDFTTKTVRADVGEHAFAELFLSLSFLLFSCRFTGFRLGQKCRLSGFEFFICLSFLESRLRFYEDVVDCALDLLAIDAGNGPGIGGNL